MAKPSREIEVPKIASQSGDPGLYEVLRDIVKRTSAYVNDLIDTHRHVPGDVDDLTAASIENVPAGTISSTNVQTALNELDSEKITTDGTARTIVKKAGTVVGTRRGINLIEGANVTLTVADDGANEEVDITIAATGAAGVGGSGTPGAIPKFTAATTLGDSVLTESSGKIGLNQATPAGVCHITNETTAPTLLLEGVGATANPFGLTFRARGTPAAKTAILANDYIGGSQYMAYNGAYYPTVSGAAVAAIASENWSVTNNGCDMVFIVTANGYAGVSEGLRVRNDGALQIKGGPLVVTDTGSPENVVTAPIGSLFFRTDGGAGTTLYVKESGAGNTGWIAK